jgi:hypothetical protein
VSIEAITASILAITVQKNNNKLYFAGVCSYLLLIVIRSDCYNSNPAAGKPYPIDYTSIGIFDKIVNISKLYSNCSVLVGYELKLSKLLKHGADVWLNAPRLSDYRLLSWLYH